MKFRAAIVVLSAAGVLAVAGPALAQSEGAGGSGGSNAHAGGSSVSTGNSESSAAVKTTGGSNVGVVQGNVAEGSTANGNQNDDANQQNASGAGGDAVGGSGVGANAAQDGVVSQLDLPAIGVAGTPTNASSTRPGVFMWALAGAIALGLAVVYRRLPRPSAT